mmetsp:Transcript_36939/g.44689  ORF Transcript_36939/g.44689 Transcript_36939/m.44689 type:complete len:200 (+) Transcript_36939:1076-1675(+)
MGITLVLSISPLQTGHCLQPWSIHLYKHGQQYRCPQRVTTGSVTTSKQTLQSKLRANSSRTLSSTAPSAAVRVTGGEAPITFNLSQHLSWPEGQHSEADVARSLSLTTPELSLPFTLLTTAESFFIERLLLDPLRGNTLRFLTRSEDCCSETETPVSIVFELAQGFCLLSLQAQHYLEIQKFAQNFLYHKMRLTTNSEN